MSMTLAADPRSDPRLAALFAEVFQKNAPHTGFSWAGKDAEAKHELVAEMETELEYTFDNTEELPEVEGVERSTEIIESLDGADVHLSIVRPSNQSGPLPAVVRLHSGGYCMLDCDNALFRYWNNKMASMGVIVVACNARSAGGKRGNYPFPCAANDIISTVEWVNENKESLNSSITILSGEGSGGGLACGAAIEFLQNDEMELIQGVFAQCPSLYGNYDDIPSFLPSVVENDGYWMGANQLSVLHSLYDLGGHQFEMKNPVCWPFFAKEKDLKGLCPHVISVNELDVTRDEAVLYAHKLKQAGVNAQVRCVMGSNMAVETLGMMALPEMHEETMHNLKAFADDLAEAE